MARRQNGGDEEEAQDPEEVIAENPVPEVEADEEVVEDGDDGEEAGEAAEEEGGEAAEEEGGEAAEEEGGEAAEEQIDYVELANQALDARATRTAEQIQELEDLEIAAGALTDQEQAKLEFLQEQAARPPVMRKTSRKWWDDLYNSKLDREGCVFELVDNALGHPHVNMAGAVKLNVDIILTESDGNAEEAKQIEIRDNAKGISRDDLDAVLSMWGKTDEYENNISEHGCGMKYGIRGLGKEVEIITKTKDDPLAMKVTTEDILSMDTVGFRPEYVEWEGATDHGTHIRIFNLEDQGKIFARMAYQINFHNYLLKILGHRYQLVLGSKFEVDDPDGGLRLHRILNNGQPPIIERVQALAPIYYCTRDNAANYSLKKVITDPRGEWEIELIAGRYPDYENDDGTRSEAWNKIAAAHNEDFVRKRRMRDSVYDGEPYLRKQGNAGFDIVRRSIVVEKGFLHGPPPYRISDISVWNPDYMPLIGQITINKGFKSGTQKIGITRDKHFEEMCEAVTKVLYGNESFYKADGTVHTENFMRQQIRGSKTGDKTEKELEAGLVDKWRKPTTLRLADDYGTFPDFDRKDIFRQVWDGVGRVDIMINETSKEETICVEVKKGNAIGKDVYQLLMYMNDAETKWGILAAEGFMDGADKAMKAIRKFVGTKKYKFGTPRILFLDLKEYNVTIPPDINKHVKKRTKEESADNLIGGRLPGAVDDDN